MLTPKDLFTMIVYNTNFGYIFIDAIQYVQSCNISYQSKDPVPTTRHHVMYYHFYSQLTRYIYFSDNQLPIYNLLDSVVTNASKSSNQNTIMINIIHFKNVDWNEYQTWDILTTSSMNLSCLDYIDSKEEPKC